MLKPTNVSYSLFVVLLTMLVTSSGLFAQGNVKRPKEGTWVSDATNSFNVAELEALNKLCDEINQKSGAEVVVVMIPSTNGVDYIEFATDLFNLWGIGSAADNNGVLIFVAKQDRKFYLTLGEGIDTDGQAAMSQSIFDRVVKPNFREGKFGEGTYLAAFQCAEQVLGLQDLEAPKSLSEVSLNLPENSAEPAENPAANQPNSPPANTSNNPPPDDTEQSLQQSPEEVADEVLQDIRRRHDPNFERNRNNNARNNLPRRNAKKKNDAGPLMLLFLITGGTIGLGGVALIGGRFLLRGRTRVCPKCQSAMDKLDEQQDDEYLEPPEQLEERLGSVNYDVWACMTCEDVIKLRYGVFFSRYSVCPQCTRKTKSKISRTLVAATEQRGGVVEVTESCANCSYHHQYTYRTPRKSRSSSGTSSRLGGGGRRSGSFTSRSGRSSGGGRSFGGGRSSGRGGGGGW